MKLALSLVFAFGFCLLGLSPAGTSGTAAESCFPLVEVATAFSCVEVVVIADVAEGEPISASTNWHQFRSVHGWSCKGIPTSPSALNVCAEGKGSMAFSTGCAGSPPANGICLQVSGDASGSAVGFPGKLTAGLSHMTSETCSWPGLAGGSCSVVFRDPDTGLTVHKHWHSQTNTWQCHYGTATAEAHSSSGGLVDYTQANYETCYKYGPL